MVVRAPIGSVAIAPASSSLLPESAAPYVTRIIGTIEAPKTVQKTTERFETVRGK